MGTKQHKYELGQHVRITELKVNGRVETVRFARGQALPMYEVSCAHPLRMEFVFHVVAEDELTEVPELQEKTGPRSIPLPDPLPR